MVHATAVFYASLLVQAVGALVLAVLLAVFHRVYGRDYLRQWAWSWWALCVYLVASGLSIYLIPRSSPLAPDRLLLSAVSLVAGYWEVAWLLFGTYEVATGRVLERRLRRGVLAGLLALSLASLLLTLTVTPTVRLVGRFGLRSLLASLAFLLAGVAVLRHGRRQASLGRRLVGVAFLLYGLRLLEYVATALLTFFEVRLDYTAYLGPLDLLLQSLIGLGLVVWLLEEERRRLVEAGRQIEHLAYHDPLTGLPNRNQFLETLRQAIARAGPGGRLAVAFLDLDRFKVINDSLGHAAGDLLLQAVAERLRTNLRSAETLARLGGDEFVVLLADFGGPAELLRALDRLLVVLRQPFALQGKEVFSTGSLGVARYPEDGEVPEELVKRADIAMYKAKDQGRDRYLFYAPSMDSQAVTQLSLETDLRRAVAQGELELHFQPVVRMATGRAESVEALVRWRHPRRGLLVPAEFLWLAEAAGLSDAVDLWVLRAACGTLRSWRETGLDVRGAVNLSARPFQEDGLVERVRAALADCGLPAAALEIEITETLAMQSAEASLGVLRGLKQLGVGITIDDFGTGYSSLAYLRDFPLDTVKVDASFVRGLPHDRGSASIAAAVIALAHQLGIEVVAEGVEEEAQWHLLAELGCDAVQGFLVTPPLPADECLAWLRGRAQRLAAAG